MCNRYFFLSFFFILLGIGVDDMFILMSGLASAPLGKSTEDRIGRTMQSSGVAITITSLTNVTAFAVGMLSSFQSVRNFCFYSGKFFITHMLSPCYLLFILLFTISTFDLIFKSSNMLNTGLSQFGTTF